MSVICVRVRSAYVSVIILFIEPWKVCFCAIIMHIHDNNPHTVWYMSECVSGSQPLCPASPPLLSGLAYFLLYCSAVPVMSTPQPVVATVDPSICSLTLRVQWGNREPAQLLPQRPNRTRQVVTSRRFKQVSQLTDWQLPNKSSKQMLLLFRRTIQCEQLSQVFFCRLHCNL